jgi:uncharacterized protein YrrD
MLLWIIALEPERINIGYRVSRKSQGRKPVRRACIAMVSFAALGGVALAQAGAPHFVAVDPTDMLTSRVVGVTITDPSSNNVGKIEDVVFEGSHAAKGYIVSVGGFLGMDSRYVIVDPKSLKVSYDSGVKQWRASINASKAQLKAAPEFKYEGQWKASKS